MLKYIKRVLPACFGASLGAGLVAVIKSQTVGIDWVISFFICFIPSFLISTFLLSLCVWSLSKFRKQPKQ